MLFPSEEFLFVFLPVVVTVYYAFLRKTKKAKNIFLLITSLFFYAWGEPGYVFLMMATIAFNYAYGLLVDKFRDDRIKGRIEFGVISAGFIMILAYFQDISQNTLIQLSNMILIDFVSSSASP